jgi:hypothetical protein
MGAAAKLQPAHDANALTRARMVGIMDQNVERLFLGSISLARRRA